MKINGLALWVGIMLGSAWAAAEERVDFARDIRPILSNTCFKCHGPDEGERKADLRLDTREGAFADLGGYSLIVPGKRNKSELFKRITTKDADDLMPPPDSGKVLSEGQIELIGRWIDEGAAWGTHWAFIPPQRPAVPKVRDKKWVRNPIDAFVLAKLEFEKLKPSPEADATTLARRLSLDITGLPPSEPGRIDVEVLLASPHYGEKWGRQWLDAARYADSDGYEKDKPRFVWFYRDWVVAALNADLPYDQFVIQQIAGDLIQESGVRDQESARQDRLVATGFLRNSMINEEGGIDPEQFRMEAMFDRMDAIGKAVLGLTIQCSQCHAHKYDPFTQADYYRMFAFINNSHEANVTTYTPAEQQKIAEIHRKIGEIEAGLKMEGWEEKFRAWEKEIAAKPQAVWTVLDKLEVDDGAQRYLPQPDGSYLAQGYAPTLFKPVFHAKTQAQRITGFRLELLTDPNLPRGGPGRSIQGTAALSEFEVDVTPTGGAKSRVKFVRVTADLNAPQAPLNEAIYKKWGDKPRVTGPVEFAIDGKQETAWTTDAGPGQRNQPRTAVFIPEQPIDLPGGGVIDIWLGQFHGGPNSDDNQNHNVGRFRLSITDSPDPAAPQPMSFAAWRATVPEWKEANDRIEALWREHPEGATQLALAERSDGRSTHRLDRGDFLKPAEVVEGGTPSFLHPWPKGAPRNRLGFAQWLVDRNSPTTARSIVNRIWQSYFGIGLVETSEDLGSQSATPSHPELLDWLAVELMESGWSLKHLHRLIVESSTYRQSSKVTPELYAKDPYNRLLARGSRFRVDGETVRDIALAASGLLNPAVGGPPVYPPAPAFLFQPPASYGPKNWDEVQGPDRYRRAIYTFRYRSVPYPALETFDAPKGDFSCVRRGRSNTPLQALTTLNEPLFMETARALAMLTITQGGATDADRIAYTVQRCLSRGPKDAERALLLDLLGRQVKRYTGDDSAAWALAAENPDKPPQLPAGITPAQLAAWTAVCRVLLNLDETITKE